MALEANINKDSDTNFHFADANLYGTPSLFSLNLSRCQCVPCMLSHDHVYMLSNPERKRTSRS